MAASSARSAASTRSAGSRFIIPAEVMALLPKGEVTDEAVAREMKYLTDEWLCDVATDYAGKCIIIAAALTIIQRSLLDSRPTFFVTAGRRGSGKTTVLTMLIKAVTGIWPAAAAWSSNEEERRKALLSYFLSGVSYILWDNIPRGTQISCPHIERSCTSAFYIDRRLGVSEAIRTAAGAIHLFTGNAIGAKGDMASRSLTVQLAVDRADPENRDFKHPDPVAWTDAHRVEILRALYTILLGNPTLKKPRNAAMRTRFKMWWRLVGSAVEHAAVKAAGVAVDFQTLFLAQDEEDEDDNALVEALITLRTWAAERKKAAEAADEIGSDGGGKEVRQRPNRGRRRASSRPPIWRPRSTTPRCTPIRSATPIGSFTQRSNRATGCPRRLSAYGSRRGSASR